MICEVENCDKQATVFVRDAKEVPPKGNEWRRFEPINPPHCFCEEHQRDSIRYPLFGNPEIINSEPSPYGPKRKEA